MERALRESLSVQRANAFVKSLPGGKGDAHRQAPIIPIDGASGFTDLIALLLHSESAEARYRLEVERVLREDESAAPWTARRLLGRAVFHHQEM